MRHRVSTLFLAMTFAAWCSSVAQSGSTAPCTAPVAAQIGNEANMFNDQQEEWLGDVLAQQLQRNYNVVEDPEGGYLQKLGERILAQLPPTKVHYRFSIIDLPINNSFGLAGGRVYVSRKLIAFAQNQDELAGVLGHEIGHIITHQSAIYVSAAFRDVLGVSQVTDRQDIFDKWNRLMDNAARWHANHSEKQEQREQLIADRIGIFAMARAGYQTSRYSDFFDRLAQTKGNVGNAWTDFFGATSSDSKRLRELLKNPPALPGNCITPPAIEEAGHFARWQRSVIESRQTAGKEELPGLIRKVELKPALRGDVDHIRFSPDGKFILAQDDGSIFLLSHDPFQHLFRIDAREAYNAQFSPDSRFVVFHDKGLRVEKWEISSGQRVWAHELVAPGDCTETSLSPSGEVLACTNREFELQLIDVNTGKPFFDKKNFYTPSFSDALSIVLTAMFHEEGWHLFAMGFSPDERYFLIGRNGTSVGYDLKTRSEIKLPGKIKQLSGFAFTFTASDKLVGVDFEKPAKSAHVRFPSGEVIDELELGRQGLSTSAEGKYLMLRPVGNAAVGVMELATRKSVMGFKKPGYDIYGKVFAAEQANGELGIFKLDETHTIVRASLPNSPLAGLRASEFSSDGSSVAISGRTRGAVWDLTNGERKLYVRGFEGSLFDKDGVIFKVAKFGTSEPKVVKLDPVSKQEIDLYNITGDHVSQLGELLISLQPAGKEGNIFAHATMEVHDIRTNKLLWTREFDKEVPSFRSVGDSGMLTMLFSDYNGIKAEAKGSAEINRQLGATDSKKDAYLVEVLESKTGKNLGGVVVDTNKLSFKVRSALAAGDSIVISDSQNRTIVYSLKSGQQKGKVFGQVRAVSRTGDKMLVENENGKSDIFDLSNMQPLSHFSFPSRIMLAAFSLDGSSVSILTADQMVYALKTAAVQTAVMQ